ncbi:MAG: 3-mercaptopyruvate sulfurtransferase [Rhodospirillaceae bacterium]|nr:3-mercaptopyruvate sulfurtransferase [Rhodospirillaceae bacterium]MBT6607788.1 3-mercaptopyruvate sulfurtransferase [Rhodospirillaceae bacterium]MBT6884920.1 3-mercaptopyruvate sulfurtransferase [Rhodospirillaceae bacterium]
MDYANPEALVSTEWLADHLDAPDVRVVDATWFLPNDERTGRAAYDEAHIPGAVFFDIDEIADTDSDLPHMLPSPEKFSSRVRNLGLGDGNKIVVYDANGGFMAACRVWWSFRMFGHDDIAVLDGGLPKWIAEGRPTEDLPPAPQPRHFTARQNNFLVRSVDQIISNCDSSKEQVIDARSAGRFHGAEDEPRPGQRKGHIPNSFSIPFQQLMNPADNWVFRPADQIQAVVDEVGLDPKAPMVASCGSGVTACVIGFGLYLLGHKEVAIYDGSWTEWGGRPDTPIVLE